ncbi:hypothetical protein [Larkinella terrae]|nr:hypothetical protein [Larkinella terrae]
MKTVIISLFTILCALTWLGFGRVNPFDSDDDEITWDEIDEDLWP